VNDRATFGGAAILTVSLALMLIGLPLLGIIISGKALGPYLEFPPQTRYVRHAGFSWPWFAFFSAADLLLIGGLLWAVRCGRQNRPPSPARNDSEGFFPWWGGAGLLLCLLAWFVAWKRLAGFWLVQPHTFLPIWAGFILFLNALSVKRSGSCLLLRRPLRFLLLFPASAGFWWFFEFLNRFVQNWFYVGVDSMGPAGYAYDASLSFATVLPGVLSMNDLLLTIPALGHGLAHCRPIRLPASRWIPLAFLIMAGIGLSLIGLFPNQLFGLLWVAPLIIILSIQALAGGPTPLYPLSWGDWRPVVVPALAALICGFFWEMWNYFSLAHWTYSIPLVQRFHLFAMPILGYGGYLPFGLECLVVGGMVIGDLFTQRT
jgi:hypothetical protein